MNEPQRAAPDDTTQVPAAAAGPDETTSSPRAPAAGPEDTTLQPATPTGPEEETRDGSAPAPLASPGDPDPGWQLGPYRLERELGRGGVGAVWLAIDTRLDRRVALKLLRAGPQATPAELERFRLEARAAARLDHEHLVRIHEVGEHGGLSWLAMDLIEGPSLRERLQAGPFEPREAARIVARLAHALQHAHARGILHRDVKPGNVLLDPSGQPRLTDFGLAKELGSEQGLTLTGDVLGTPAYMAPEQAAGDAALVDRRSDVYGLGATLYALLTGRPPFVGVTTLELLAQLQRVDPQPPSRLRAGLDRDLDTITLRCLEKEPQRRYATAGELAADLERWLAHQPILARPAGPLERIGKWLRRNRSVARAGGAVAAVAVLVIVSGSVAFGVQLARARALAEENERAAREQAARADRSAAEARAEAARADENAHQADERSQIAYRALSTLVIEVQKQLEDLPGERLRAVRQKLVADAMQELSRLRQTEPEDAPITLLAAEAQRAWGDLLGLAGREDEASAALERALSMTRSLVSAQPDPVNRAFLAVCLDACGDQREELGDVAGAQALFAEGLALRRELLAAAPDDLNARRNLAVSLRRKGDLERVQGDLPAARATYEEWLALCEELARAEPAQPRRRLEVAFALLDLGDVLEAQGELGPAMQRDAQVEQLCRALLAEQPEDTLALEYLAQARGAQAGIHELRAEVEAARAAQDEAVGLLRRLARLDPGAEADYRLAIALGRAGRLYQRDDLGRARELLGEAAALREQILAREPKNAAAQAAVIGSQLDLADLARDAGDVPAAQRGYAQALERARALAAADPLNAPNAFNVVVVLSRQVELHAKQGQLDEALRGLDELLPLLEQLGARDPTNYQPPFLRSQLCELQGKIHQSQGRREEALRSFRAALAAARRLLDIAPDHANALDRVTNRLDQIAQLVAADGDRAQALALHQEAAQLCRDRLAAAGERAPEDEVVYRNLAIFTRLVALDQLALGDLPAALESARAARAQHERVCLRYPQHALELPYLIWDQVRIAVRLAERSQGPEAKAAHAEALEALRALVMVDRALIEHMEGNLADPQLPPADAEALREQIRHKRAELSQLADEPELQPLLEADRSAFHAALAAH